MSTRSFFESRNTSMTVYRFVQWLLHLFTRERGGWREAGEEGEERDKRGRERVDVSYVHSYTFIYQLATVVTQSLYSHNTRAVTKHPALAAKRKDSRRTCFHLFSFVFCICCRASCCSMRMTFTSVANQNTNADNTTTMTKHPALAKHHDSR